MNLAWFRGYDPDLARWLSRDPIGLHGGLNVYGYVDNDPANDLDPVGLAGGFAWASVGIENPGPIRLGPEGVAILGYDTTSSWYVEAIGAAGVNVGGESNYIAGFEGGAAEYSINDGLHTDGISLREISVGPEVPFVAGLSFVGGLYRQDKEGWGVYFGLHEGFVAEHAAIGIGLSLPNSWYTKTLDFIFSKRNPNPCPSK